MVEPYSPASSYSSEPSPAFNMHITNQFSPSYSQHSSDTTYQSPAAPMQEEDNDYDKKLHSNEECSDMECVVRPEVINSDRSIDIDILDKQCFPKYNLPAELKGQAFEVQLNAAFHEGFVQGIKYAKSKQSTHNEKVHSKAIEASLDNQSTLHSIEDLFLEQEFLSSLNYHNGKGRNVVQPKTHITTPNTKELKTNSFQHKEMETLCNAKQKV